MKKSAYVFKKSRIFVKNRTNMKQQPLFCSMFVKKFEKTSVFTKNSSFFEKVSELFHKKFEKISKNYLRKKVKFDFGRGKRRFFAKLNCPLNFPFAKIDIFFSAPK